MDNEKTKSRGGFKSSAGFILASAGAAIGLGNLWKFPYVAGKDGGGLFILFYVLFSAFLGVPIIISEMAVGRKTRVGVSEAYGKLSPRWSFLGKLGVLCSFVLLCYYVVVGGWVVKYAVSYLLGTDIGNDTALFFDSFIAKPIEPVLYALVFIAACAFIVFLGVSNGIEKAGKIMLPALFAFLVILALRSLSLPGAWEGMAFLFRPDFGAVSSPGQFFRVVASALSQTFFSLSLGMGITVTYGSYLSEKEDIKKSTAYIVALDVLIAVLSGVAIFPAVFSFGLEVSSGPGLMFHALPQVFDSIAFGNMFGAIFFILVFFAAVTSAIASLEVVSAFLIDGFGFKRRTAIIASSLCVAAFGTLASLSNGPWADFKIIGMSVFDFFVFAVDKILIPIAAILTCVFVGYTIKPRAIISEAEIGSTKFRFVSLFEAIMKYIAPVLIFIIFIIGILNK